MFSLQKILLCISFLLFIHFSYAKKRVACIGDSVTKGYGIKDSTKSYPSQLQKLLGDDFEVGNFGHSGATLLKHGHNPYIKTSAYQEALNFNADIIIIALGLNDTDPRNWPNYKHDFIRDYSSLINDFRSNNPNVEVFVCKMTPIFSGHRRFLSGTREWFSQIQEILPQIANANRAKLIDNHEVLSARIDLFDDYLHPNSRGAEILAHHIYNHLGFAKNSLSVNYTLGSQMVLQRSVVNKIQGKAKVFADVKLIFNKVIYSTKSDQLGNWNIELPKMKAGGPYDIKIISENENLILTDILFGDVYLSSGQSNMAFELKDATGSDEILKKVSDYKNIRIFKNNNLIPTHHTSWDSITLQAVNELHFFSGKWESCNRQSVSSFSAIAFRTALELYEKLSIPIGIIDISVGGSNIESWIPRSALEQDNVLSTYIHNWRESDFIQDFCRQRANKNLENSKIKNQRHPYDPSYNFEAGISKWCDVNINGVLWYQGESNAHNIEHHTYMFPIFVNSWRKAFNQPMLPFYFVQLSSINRPSWSDFRNSQRLLTNKIDNIFMAVSSDLGHPTDVHPKNKFPIGNRLANLILQNIYKHTLEANSPQPIFYKRSDDRLLIEFSNCNNLILSNGEVILDLICLTSTGNRIIISDAKIDNNALNFNIPKDAQWIQYGYQCYTQGNLFSDSGVPVSTFELKL